ncbi:MAG TPA: TonB family protein [Longimicrobium sp.]|nr:TonB family protein [Longimicrobium sp.]
MPDSTLAPPPAAPAPLVRRRSTNETIALDPALELGVGGEAHVFALPGGGGKVAKLYHRPTLDRARKLARMIEAPPELPPGGAAALAWPEDLLTDARGRFVGFLMPFAAGARVFELYNPVTRRKEAPLFHWGLLHRAGASLAAAFDALHARGYVVGDVNESNILVSPAGTVTLVDTDSFQVRDGQGVLHRSHVGKAEFTAPELQGMSFAEVDRSAEHDRFGLAVLLFLLLMEGTHPYAARFEGAEEAPPVEERIRAGLFPHAEGAGARPPRLAPPFGTLPPELRALFVTAFVDGHADPSVRPTAAEWRAALEFAEGSLAVCAANGQHRYAAHLGALCPWCHRTRLLRGRDPFPATEAEARRTDAAPLPARLPRRPADLDPVLPAPKVPKAAAGTQTILPAPMSPLGIALLGPAGVQNPAAWLLPMLVLMSAAGIEVLQIAGALGVVGSVSRLWRQGGVGPVRPVTVGAAMLLALLAGMLSALTYPMPAVSAIDPYAHTSSQYPVDVPLDREGYPVEATGIEPTEPRAPLQRHEGERIYAPWEVQVKPEPANPGEVQAWLWETGVRGRAEVGVKLETDGSVRAASIDVHQSSSDAFTPVAVEAVKRMRFTPARIEGIPVRVAITIPVEAYPERMPGPAPTVRVGTAEAGSGARPLAKYDGDRLYQASEVQKPVRLLNAGEIEAAGREIPWKGTVRLGVYVDTDGRPGVMSIQSSGSLALDNAATELVQRMRFAPASIDGTPVRVTIPVEVTLPGGRLP